MTGKEKFRLETTFRARGEEIRVQLSILPRVFHPLVTNSKFPRLEVFRGDSF